MNDWQISSAELKECFEGVTLIDVREPEEWSDKRIPGAIHMPLGDLRNRTGDLDPHADLVIYCAHGYRSVQAVLLLQALEFERVRSLTGGLEDWEAQGGAIDRSKDDSSAS